MSRHLERQRSQGSVAYNKLLVAQRIALNLPDAPLIRRRHFSDRRPALCCTRQGGMPGPSIASAPVALTTSDAFTGPAPARGRRWAFIVSQGPTETGLCHGLSIHWRETGAKIGDFWLQDHRVT